MVKHLFLSLIIALSLLSCKESTKAIEGKRIEINDSIANNEVIEDFIKPFKANVNKNLDSVIAYAAKTYSKSDGLLNTAIGNLMADAVYSESNPIFNKRTGKNIDFVLLNHGGIRAKISEGQITIRTAYEVMPFENSVVVVALKGHQIDKMLLYLAVAKRAHPISEQLKIVLDGDYNVKTALINNKSVVNDNIYYVATNDYLYNGGDRMTFFQPNNGLHVLDYKIRNVLIDYFKKSDTINPKIDERFILLK